MPASEDKWVVRFLPLRNGTNWVTHNHQFPDLRDAVAYVENCLMVKGAWQQLQSGVMKFWAADSVIAVEVQKV